MRRRIEVTDTRRERVADRGDGGVIAARLKEITEWCAPDSNAGREHGRQFSGHSHRGLTHCGGGEGPDSFDVLTPVMAWVETGTVPDQIIASKVANNITTRSRPVFPYPTVARYLGSGSIDDPTRFVAYTPRGGPGSDSSDYNWVGKQLYSSGYQAWCQAVGTQLVCQPSSLPFHE